MKRGLFLLGAGIVALILAISYDASGQAKAPAVPVSSQPNLSGNNSFSGNNTFSGSNTFSGVNVFTRPLTADGGLAVNGVFNVDGGPAIINSTLGVDGGATFNANVRFLSATTIPSSVCINIDGTYDCNNGFQWNGTTLAIRSGGGTAISINPGSGLMTFGSGYSITIGGGTAISASHRGTVTTDIGSTLTQTCASDVAVTVTGASTTAECVVGAPNAANVAGAQFTCYISATNTAQLRMCCNGAATCDPPSATYSIRTFNP